MLLVSWKNGALACDKLFTVVLERFFFLTVGFSLINLIFTIKELIYELEVWHHQRLFRTNGNLNIRTSYTRPKLDYLLVHSGTPWIICVLSSLSKSPWYQRLFVSSEYLCGTVGIKQCIFHTFRWLYACLTAILIRIIVYKQHNNRFISWEKDYLLSCYF